VGNDFPMKSKTNAENDRKYVISLNGGCRDYTNEMGLQQKDYLKAFNYKKP